MNQKNLRHWRRYLRAKVTSFGKELPHDVSHIAPHLLSKWENEKKIYPPLTHKLQATMKATLMNFVNIRPCHLFTCHYLMNNWPMNDHFLMRFVLSMMMCRLGEVERGISFQHLSRVENCTCFIVFANILYFSLVLGNKSLLSFVWASNFQILKFSCRFNCPIKSKQKYKGYLLNNPPPCSPPHEC